MTLSFFRTKSQTSPRISLRRPAFRLDVLEPLEDRLTPAATFTWIGPTTGGSWDVPANWSLVGTSTLNYPNAVGDIANLVRDFTGTTATINLNVPVTLSGLFIDDTGDPTDSRIIIAAGTAGKLTLDNSGAGVSIANAGGTGTNAISADITLADNLSVITTNSITFTGTIDESGGARSITKSNTSGNDTALALAGANTFSGGIVLNAGAGNGVLRINNGGTASASALGTGPLTINGGTVIDNTSGAPVSIATGNAINWNGNFTFTGTNPLNLGSGTVTMAANVSVATAANTLTFDGIVQGNFNLTKTGVAGRLVLTNSGNTFGGSGKLITVTSGLLAVANDGALGDASNTITFNGGGIGYSAPGSYTATTTSFGGHTINALASGMNRGYGALDGVTLEITDAMTNVLGTNGLAIFGAGTGKVVSTQNNTFNGPIIVNSGTFQTNDPSSLGNNAGLTLAGGTLALRSDVDTNFNKNLTVNANSIIDINQDSGAGSNKTITLGTVTVVNLAVNLTANGGNGYVLSTGPINLSTAGADPTFSSNIANWTIPSISAPNNLAGNDTVVTFGGSGTTIVTGAISAAAGTLSVVRNGGGTVLLLANNTTLNNGVTITLGALQTSNPSSLGTNSGPSAIVLAGGVLQLRNDNDTNFSKNVTVSANSTIDINQETGAGSDKTLTLGNVTFTGGTTARNLTVNSGNGYSLAVGNLTMDSTQDPTITNNANLVIASVTGNGAMTINENDLTFTGSGTTAITGNIVRGGAGPGFMGLTKSGTGLLVLSGSGNTYNKPTIVANGALRLASANALPGGIASAGGTSGLNLAGGVVELANGDFSRGLGTGISQVQFTGTGGGFSAFGAPRFVNLGGSVVPSTVTWASGGFVPNNASLILGSSYANDTITLQNPIALGVATRTIQVDNGSAAVDAILEGAVSGVSGGLVKTGAGVLSLIADNTYGSGTAISAGTLLANNANGSATGSGPVSVNAGGALGGTGSVGGALTINGGGTLSPGNGIGAFTVNDAPLTFIPTGNYNWQINNATHDIPAPGVDYDTVIVTGTSTLDLSNLSTSNRFNINLWSLTGGNVNGNAPNWDNSQAHVWTLVETPNTIVLPNGIFDNNYFNVNVAAVNGTGGFTNPLNGIFTVALSPDGTDLFLKYSSVTATTYTLGASAAAPNIRAATGSSTISTTITNTGTTGAQSDTIFYTSLGSSVLPAAGTLTPGAGGGSVAANAAGTASANASQTFSNAAAGSYVFTPDAGTVTSPFTSPTLTGSPGTATVGVYDLAQPQYTGGTLNFGNIHVGATVSNQTVAFTNPALTNASFQDSLDVSATTNNASVSATGFTGLLANGLAQNLSIAVNTSAPGTLNSSLTLSLVSNANGVNGLSNTALTPNATINTTGHIYSGIGVWNTNGGGNWNDFTRWTENGGAPGLDADFATTDSATFGTALTSAPAIIFLNNAQPSINSLTFDNQANRYTIARNANDEGAITLRAGGQSASINVAAGVHTIAVPLHLASNLTAAVASAVDSLTLAGPIDGDAAFTKNGSGTLILSGVNTYTGDTVVTAGRLVVNTPPALGSGTGAGRVIIEAGAVLSGSGKIAGPVDIEEGAEFSPGTSPGTIGTGSLSLKSNSTLNEEIENAGSYDIINVTGTVNLNANAKLRVFLDISYTPDPGQQFTIINNDDVDAISGLFKDYSSPNAVLAEGDTFSAGGNLFSITYVGGTGNDIILTCVNPSVTSLTPMIGPTIGGTIVIITGVNFSGTTFADATSVTFGGLAATTYTVNSSSQITATAPAGASIVNVAVTRGGVTSDINGSGDNFTYSAPAVASVVVNGGPDVTLSGTGSVVSLGAQNSVVKQILVTFNQAVTVASDAFTVTPRITNVTVSGGASPSAAAATTSVTSLTPSTYLVTFVVDGTSTNAAGVLKSGVYDLTTIASKVTANGETMTSDATTAFFSMFGTIDANNTYTMGTTGDGGSKAFVDPGSLFQFSDTFGASSLSPVGPPAYNIVFDSNLDGAIDPGDLFAFSDSFGINWNF